MDNALRAFADWMDQGGPLRLLPVFVLLALAQPVLTFFHELGHALVALARTEGLVVLRVGDEPALVRGRLGRLDIRLNALPVKGDVAGMVQQFGRMSPRERIAFALAGPVAQLLVIAAAFGAYTRGDWTRSGGVLAAALIATYFAVSNLVPRRRGELRSDGQHVVDALGDSRAPRLPGAVDSSNVAWFEDEFDATLSRFTALVSDRRGPAYAQHRLIWLQAAVSADDADHRRLFSLGVAGWCWRACERRNVHALAGELAAARAQLGAEPGVPTVLRTLAGAGFDASAASPGRSPTEKRGFLRRAFRTVAGFAKAPDDDDHRRAFLCGVLLHDLESLQLLEG